MILARSPYSILSVFRPGDFVGLVNDALQRADMRLAAGLSAGLAKLIESNADGHRDHNETLAIAAVIRPHIGALQGSAGATRRP